MCGRYTLVSNPESIRALFRYADRPNFPARYNIAPTQPIAVVRLFEGKVQFALLRWGLIPAWVKDPRSVFASDQRARRIGAGEAGLPLSDARSPLPDPVRWLLRMESSAASASSRITSAPATAARWPLPACGKPGWVRTARRWKPPPSSPRAANRSSRRCTTACR